MFEKTLSDLVRGIRAHKGEEGTFIASCLSEIKSELRQENPLVKANAVSKLIYIQMLGYDIEWAAFNIIEVMSNPKFTCKRIGYLAATQCFHEGTDVVMLCTNLIRKDLSSGNIYDTGLAMNGLACFVTTDLARDLANDVLALCVSSKPYVRKKALLVMYKIFLRFPDALRPAFSRLKEKIEDPDSSVQCAAVSVICELARKNPKNYISLAPTLFKIMQDSNNNWMLIKIIKLFGAITPLEPRLAKKLQDPLTTLIHSTSAMSLLFECVMTVISGMPKNVNLMQLCVSKLRLFVEDSDQNLRYLGLLAMSKILPHQPKALLQLKDLVMECLDSHDDSIRLRALDLIVGMVTKKNLVEIVKRLVTHIEESESTYYRDEVISKVISMCRQSNYQYITDFEWYITVLVGMTKFEGTTHGKLLASQILDVTIRVKDVRQFSVKQMVTILDNTHLFLSKTSKDGICEVLYAAAWVVGEFSEYLSDPREVLDVMLNPKVTSLPGHIQAVFVQNILKLYASILVQAESQGAQETIEEVGGMLVDKLPAFVQSGDLEVQERACCILQLMKYIVKLQGKGASVSGDLAALFAGELNPVAPKAQKKVPVPDGLDLDKWINEPIDESDKDEDFSLGDSFSFVSGKDSSYNGGIEKTYKKKSKKEEKEEQEEMERMRKQREVERASNPHYLPMISGTRKNKDSPEVGEATDSIPISKVNLGSLSLVIDDAKEKGKKAKKGKKGKKGKGRKQEKEEEEIARPVVMVAKEEMPEGAVGGSSEEDENPTNDALDEAHRKLNIDLSEPLRDDEILPVPKHRVVPETAGLKLEDEDSKGKKKKKKKKKKHAEEEAEVEEPVSSKKKTKEKEGKSKKKSKKDKAAKSETTNSSLVEMVEEEEEKELQATPEATGGENKEEGNLDDLDFWLSSPATSAPQNSTPPKKEKKESAAVTVKEDTEKNAKKGKKSKGSKSKKGKKKRDEPDAEEPSIVQQEEPGEMDLMGPAAAEPKATVYQLLAEDQCIRMTYTVRPHLINSEQFFVPVIFSNLTEMTLLSLNFNVLDSLNTRLERIGVASSDEGVAVPFHLLPGASNEYQFVFKIKSVNTSQKLRGTLTYMSKNDSGTTSEKIDFKLSFKVSNFVTPVPCPREDFTSLLQGGQLCDTQTVNTELKSIEDFTGVLSVAVKTLHLAIVEQVQDGASLHGVSLSNDHICLMVKSMGERQVMINAKGSDPVLISNLLDELKLLF